VGIKINGKVMPIPLIVFEKSVVQISEATPHKKYIARGSALLFKKKGLLWMHRIKKRPVNIAKKILAMACLKMMVDKNKPKIIDLFLSVKSIIASLLNIFL
jgi:hypothetical protein